MLCKLLANDRHFSLDNVWKYLALYIKKSLSQSQSFKMLVRKWQFLLQLLLKMNAYFSRFLCKKTCPSYEFLVVLRQVQVWDWKSVGRGRCELGCPAGRDRCRLEVCRCGVGARKIFLIYAGVGRGEFKFCGAGADKNFQPMQDSIAYSKCNGTLQYGSITVTQLVQT